MSDIPCSHRTCPEEGALTVFARKTHWVPVPPDDVSSLPRPSEVELTGILVAKEQAALGSGRENVLVGSPRRRGRLGPMRSTKRQPAKQSHAAPRPSTAGCLLQSLAKRLPETLVYVPPVREVTYQQDESGQDTLLEASSNAPDAIKA